MSKKIIALCMVLVIISLVFVSCNQKPKLTVIDGVERAVALDEEGNTVLSSDGMLRVYALDEDGNITYNEDGTPQYNYVSMPDTIVDGQTLTTPEYSLTMPKGWELNNSGVFTKLGTDNKCTVRMGYADALEEISFEEYVQNGRSQNELIIATYEKENTDADATMVTKSVEFTDSSIVGTANIYKIVDAEGKVIHYAVIIYYPYNEQAYYINYACPDGVGYDESFDFISYIQENYIIK